MTPETARILAIAQGMAKSQAALGNDGSALAWATVAGEIERLSGDAELCRAYRDAATFAWTRPEGCPTEDVLPPERVRDLIALGLAVEAAAERDGPEREAMAATLYGCFETPRPWTETGLALVVAHYATVAQSDSLEAKEIIAEWRETAQAAARALVAHVEGR